MNQRRRVLVIDDDNIIRGLVSEVLENVGYSVEQAGDGAEAIEALLEHRPDLIVLDLKMPGMDGLAFLAEQRKRGLGIDVPVVVLSAAYKVGSHPRGGKLVFLPKPFDPVELLAEADRLLTLSNASRSA